MSRLLAQVPPAQTDTAGEGILGTVQPPKGVDAFNIAAGGATEGIGILIFISSLIRIATVVAGIWVLFNFITAGYDYITAGDSKANQKVREKLTNSILGLVIIVAAYVIIAVFGLILFGDSSYFLNPQICGPGVEC